MQVLVEKARTEAEEAQRILLAALNGLAGLMILDSDRPQAVALYRKAGHSLCFAPLKMPITCQNSLHGPRETDNGERPDCDCQDDGKPLNTMQLAESHEDSRSGHWGYFMIESVTCRC